MAGIDTTNIAGQSSQTVRLLPAQNSAGNISGANAGQSGNALPQDANLTPVNPSNDVTTPDVEPTLQDIEQVVTQLSDFVQQIQRDLAFSVDNNTGKTVIVVSDSETGDVIRQIPSEYVVELAQNLNDLRERLEGSKGNLLEVRV